MRFINCRAKICKLFDPEESGQCSCWKIGLGLSFIRWCPMRKAYGRVSRRISHSRWILKNRKEWNKYQKEWRKNKLTELT